MNERPKALTDAECRSATLVDICCSQAERIAVLEAALRNLVADVDDYERVNNLAPNPGRLHCWESMRVAKDVLGQSAPKPKQE